MADGLNNDRAARVAELLSDFRNLQFYIAEAPSDPPNQDDYYTEGWAQLRQCSLDGQYILNVGQDMNIPTVRGGPAEQEKAELQHVLLDAYARRHEAQKIWLRQEASQRWVNWRAQILQGQRPATRHAAQLAACDQALRAELAEVTDDQIFADLRLSDYQMGYWTQEDPSLRAVQRWVRSRT